MAHLGSSLRQVNFSGILIKTMLVNFCGFFAETTTNMDKISSASLSYFPTKQLPALFGGNICFPFTVAGTKFTAYLKSWKISTIILTRNPLMLRKLLTRWFLLSQFQKIPEMTSQKKNIIKMQKILKDRFKKTYRFEARVPGFLRTHCEKWSQTGVHL